MTGDCALPCIAALERRRRVHDVLTTYQDFTLEMGALVSRHNIVVG